MLAATMLRDPGEHFSGVVAATGAAAAVLATLAAYLLLRRTRRTGALDDAVLSGTISVLALVSGSLAMAGTEASARAGSGYGIVSLFAGLMVAGGLALAAFAPRRRRWLPGAEALRPVTWGVGGMLGVLTLLAVVLGTGAATGPAVAAADVAASLLCAAAAAGFLVRAREDESRFMGALALAAAITGVAHAADLVSPWSTAHHLSGGDVVQLAGWAALLLAGLVDHEAASRRGTVAAVEDERRRVARELHDGLAQELAYITTEARRLGTEPSAARLVKAAERALEESRTAIALLSRPPDEPLEKSIADTAHGLADRAGITAAVAVRPGLDAGPAVRQALVRILRESMTNAIRHGRADTVHVSVDGPSPLVMVVADDGRGFDISAPRSREKVGLRSMQERAENLGGRMTIESAPGQGTSVAVVLP
jgi:signal transduction histidine kinase